MKAKIIGLCLLSFIVAGCAIWTPVKSSNQAWRSGDFSAELPIGWHRSKTPEFFLYLTHDGVCLQNISVSKAKTNKELPFSKKKIFESMLLEEVSDVVLDEMRLNTAYQNFELLENKPVNLGDVSAFRLVYTFTNEDYVKFKVFHYGFIFKKKYYEIRCQATVQNNFNRYRQDFENFLSSFRVKS